MKYVCLAVLCFAWILSHAANSSAYRATEQIRPSRKQIDSQTIRNLPLRFESNQGQAADDIRYLSRGPGYSMALSARKTVLHLGKRDKRAALTMRLDGAQNGSQIRGLEPLATTSSYFLSNDPRQWRRGIPNFGRVSIEQVYPGIDLQWHGNGQQLEYDFNLAAGADPALIRMRFDGAKKIRIAKDGSLRMILGTEEIEWQRPVAYQMIDGRKEEVACRFRMLSRQRVGFALGSYERGRPLVIDPVLVYSTYIGGSGFDQTFDVATDAMGFTYLAGQTDSFDFPGPGPVQMNRAGGTDAFLLKINPAGTAVVYGAWIGGNQSESAFEIDVDPMGQAYLSGGTFSDNFPTRNAIQTTRKGAADAFLTKLNAAGNEILFSTYLGGSLTDIATGVGFDAAGNAFFAGYTESFDFPVKNAIQASRKPGAFQTSTNGGAQWTPTGTGLNVRQVNDIAVLPSNPAILYAATEQGVYKSSDSGATWTKLGANFNRSIFQLLVDPQSPDNLYVQSDGTLHRSTNGGATWTQIGSFTNIQSIGLSPTAPASTLFVATATTFYRIINGGTEWLPITLPSIPNTTASVNSIAADPSTPTTVFAGGFRALYRSMDGGVTWTTAANGLPANDSFSVTRIRVSPGNGSVLLAELFLGGVFKSVNGGANWTALPLPAVPSPGRFYFAFDPGNANTIYAGSPTNGIFKSNDGGQTWIPSNTGLNNASVRSLETMPGQPGRVLAGLDVGTDAFLAKVSAAGNELAYATYLGGSGNDSGAGLAVDAAGNAYLSGYTGSPNFPVTTNALQSTLKGSLDAFVAKIDPAGSAIVWGTYLGGDDADNATAIALDAAGAIYLAGATNSTNFPLVNPIQPANNSAAPESADAFVTRLRADGSVAEFSTYFGGQGFDSFYAIAVDGQGNAYLAGTTNSTNLPLKNPVQSVKGEGSSSFSDFDAFVAKIATRQPALIYSTYLGGNSSDQGAGIAVDAAGNAVVTGYAASTDFPLTPNPLNSAYFANSFLAMLGLRADLAVTITDLPDPVQANNDLSYDVIVENRGPDSATAVSVRITLPAGPGATSITPSQGTCGSGNPVTCTLGDIASNSKIAIAVVLKPAAVGTLTARAEIVSNNTPDANADNNQASQDTRVTSTPSIFGRVRSAAGEGLADVSLGLGGAQRPAAITTAAGNYQFAELAAGADYTVTPQRQGYVFTPANRTVQRLTNDSRADFEAIACNFSIAPNTRSVPAIGGVENISITSPDPRCTWTARSDVPWIRINGASSGTGSGSVQLTIDPTTAARSGAVLIAGRRLTIRQEFNACDAVRMKSPRSFLIAGVPTEFSSPPQTADFNKDGVSDIVLSFSRPEDGLFLSLSNSSGGYDAGQIIYRGRVRNFRPGDVNNDGNTDLLLTTISGADAQLQVLFGTGTGTFSNPLTLTTPPDPRAFAIVDLNGDGRNDIAVSATGAPPPGPIPNTANISILLATASGGFAAPRNFGFMTMAGSGVTQIESGDFNGDGKKDLAALGFFGPIHLLIGDGTGNFAITGLNLFDTDGVITVGDFNNDKKTDIAFSRNVSDGLRLWLSTPAGLPDPNPQIIKSAAFGRLIQAADLNADEKVDLISSADAGLIVLHGSGDGKFAPPVVYLIASPTSPFSIGEYNRDGRPDVFVPTPGEGSSRLGIAVLTGTAAGLDATRGSKFATSPDVRPSFSSLNPLFADFNEDGLVDLFTGFSFNEVGGSGYAYSLALGNGLGEFTPQKRNSLFSEAARYVTRDFNRDNKPDIAYQSRTSDEWRLVVRLNQGVGVFGEEIITTITPNPYSMEYADFNRDGNLDLVISAQNFGRPNGLSLYLGDGTGKFIKSNASFDLKINPAYMFTGDFNGDGNMDLFAYRYEQPFCGFDPNLVTMLPGDGKGGFGPAVSFDIKASITSIQAADVNNDGRSDLVFSGSCRSDTVFSVMLGNESGTFSAPIRIQGTPALVQNIRDFNNDGKLDMLTLGPGPGQYTFFLGMGEGSFSPSASFRLNQGNFLPEDINLDGTIDLLYMSASGYAGVVLNQSTCPRPGAATAVSAASYVPFQAAPDSIAAVFGSNLATSTQVATTLPLPTSLGALSVSLRDSGGQERLAPLFFGSPGQVNLLVPPGTAAGTALLSVKNGSTTVAAGTARIGAVAPGLFSADGTGTGLAASLVFRGKADGTQVFEPLVRFDPMTNRFVPVPIDLSNPAEQVFLLLYGTGVRNRSDLASVKVTIGGEDAEVSYAGAQGTLAGLDQINVRIPRTLAGRGLVDVVLTADGRSSNPIRIGIK